MSKTRARKVLEGFGVAVAAGALAIGLVQPASAQETAPAQLSAEFVAEVTTVWTEHSVPAGTQEVLIAKIEAGELLDSMTDAEPVAVDEVDGENVVTQVQRFADGSINVISLETPKAASDGGSVGPMSVDSCTSQVGNRYNNCLVYGWFTAVQLSFRATYVLGATAAQIIDNYNTPFVQCFPGINCGQPFFSVTRLRQSGSLPAHVSVAATWSYVGIGGGSTTYLHLYVRDRSAYTN